MAPLAPKAKSCLLDAFVCNDPYLPTATYMDILYC